MKAMSLFSGVGGFELGLPYHYEVIGHSEINKYASDVLRYHYPNIKNYGDITKINWNTVPDFDLLVGGSPCQDLSIAGKRKGLGGERSGLFFEYIRALKEKKPACFIWENVKGALSSNDGWDFATVLMEMAKAGYGVTWHVLNAKDFGVPQNRERVFVIGTRADIGSPLQIFFERQDDDVPNFKTETIKGWPQTEVSHTLRGSNVKADNVFIIHNVYGGFKEKTVREFHDFSSTLRTPKEGGHIPILYSYSRIRRFTPIECERLMGWPDEWTRYGKKEDGTIYEISDSQRYKMCGNGVVSNVIKAIINSLEEV